MRIAKVITFFVGTIAVCVASHGAQSDKLKSIPQTKDVQARAQTARTWLDTWMHCLETEGLRAASTFPSDFALDELADHSFDLCKTSEATSDTTAEAANAPYFPTLQAYREDRLKWKKKVRATLIETIAAVRRDPAGYEAAKNADAAVAAQRKKVEAALAVWQRCLEQNVLGRLTEGDYAAMPAAARIKRLDAAFVTCAPSEKTAVSTASSDPGYQNELSTSLRAQARAQLKK